MTADELVTPGPAPWPTSRAMSIGSGSRGPGMWPPCEELLPAEYLLDRIVILGKWSLDYPQASGQLLHPIAGDPATSFELTPTILGTAAVNEDPSHYGADAVLAAASPRLAAD